MKDIKINIAKDFSPNLGVRFRKFGAFSGEEFYESWLKPKYEEAKGCNQKLLIELDGATPYGSSFLDESFGKLARENGANEVLEKIEFITSLYPHVIELIHKKIWGL